MDAGLIERIENGAELGAAALFAAAVGYAAYGFIAAVAAQPQAGIVAAGAGALAYWPCSRVLRLMGRRSGRLALPDFLLRNFEFVDEPGELLLTERLASADELMLTDDDRVAPDELVLTDADRVHGSAPLDLDDILAEIGPDSRVVRLFDRKAMPPASPGQLRSRIADHLADGASRSAPSDPIAASDASHALSAALAELRRSLR